MKHFRNYAALSLTFQPGIHLFIGDNAQGKTNLLEALYVLSLSRSYRTAKDRELIQWHHSQAWLEAEIEKRHGRLILELFFTPQGKKAKLNHIERRRLSDYVGAFNVVIFAPEDLNLIKGSPRVRRRFIDLELGQISPSYLHHLGQYQKVLAQRNALLKEAPTHDPAMYAVFTQQLIDLAVPIYQKRFHFLRQLSRWAEAIHGSISQGKESIQLVYQPTAPLDEKMEAAELAAALAEHYASIKIKELRQGITLAGPHRDDVAIHVNGHDVQTFGSQGQQRTAALALKLAEIELIKEETGEYPVLLLDDVLSELDDKRRTHLLDAIGRKAQTFVTGTSLEGIDHLLLQSAQLYRVKEGQIVREN